ncbi:DUF2293 domain-containing protein [Mycolicibacterium sp. F2034L]|uniref:DUF2293 domain-containing protein n=1 Tax=Mycolicibacterium sp. F2034L TaxID=2926422 RepID=UPI001FF1F45F|nr:DUF2293 domain-containing protein [Mycolicibacterium sp. F2034L]MCK0173848.1 DUF2293 domain-containing protein [Mycolicibacterium sp. F2034L]
MDRLETRVASLAEAALVERQFVTSLDVLVGLGWLADRNVKRWMSYRVTGLALCLSVDLTKAGEALDALESWARRQGLEPWHTDYGDHRFTVDGDTDFERRFATRWARSEQPAPRVRIPRMRFISLVSAVDACTCDSCGVSDDLLIETRRGIRCLECADFGHLVFLPAGDATLTRRTAKASRFSAAVKRWDSEHNRYERQGILTEAKAIESAARQCLEDADARAARRQRDSARRAGVDEEFRGQFADAIRALFPGCPDARADAIAYHAALRGSGRGARTAAGRALDPETIRLAVAASVRHVDIDYADLLMSGVDRDEARDRVRARVEDILAAWREGVTVLGS